MTKTKKKTEKPDESRRKKVAKELYEKHYGKSKRRKGRGDPTPFTTEDRGDTI